MFIKNLNTFRSDGFLGAFLLLHSVLPPNMHVCILTFLANFCSYTNGNFIAWIEKGTVHLYVYLPGKLTIPLHFGPYNRVSFLKEMICLVIFVLLCSIKLLFSHF